MPIRIGWQRRLLLDGRKGSANWRHVLAGDRPAVMRIAGTARSKLRQLRNKILPILVLILDIIREFFDSYLQLG